MSEVQRFPAARVRWVLANSPETFTLRQFVSLYRSQYGHPTSRPDPSNTNFGWLRLAVVIKGLGAQQIGEYAVRETRFENPIAPAPQKETPAPTKPSPAPAAPTSTIERLEARLSELQRVVDLQTKIKEVEAQIALF